MDTSLSYLGPSKWNNLPTELHQIIKKSRFKTHIDLHVKRKSNG